MRIDSHLIANLPREVSPTRRRPEVFEQEVTPDSRQQSSSDEENATVTRLVTDNETLRFPIVPHAAPPKNLAALESYRQVSTFENIDGSGIEFVEVDFFV